MKKFNVLIIDDEEGMRSAIQWSLAAFFEKTDVTYVPTVCGDLESVAAALGGSEKFDLVVTDVSLDKTQPERAEGVVIANEVKILSPTTRVIVMSGGDLAFARSASKADAYLQKPFDLETFTDTLRSILVVGDVVPAAVA